MDLLTGRNTPGFAKDTVYRFMKMIQINWIRFTTILSARIIKEAIIPLDSAGRANAWIKKAVTTLYDVRKYRKSHIPCN